MAEKTDPLGGLPFPDEAQRMFSDPKFLEGAAAIAAKYRNPEAAMKWLERANLAAKEGAFEAVGHLMAGNPQEAVNLWNKTGQYRDVVNVNQNQDGTYSINRKDGSVVTMDPIKEYKRMLSPREFMSYQQNESEAKERSQRYKLEDKHREDELKERQRMNDALINRYGEDRDSREAIADLQARLRLLTSGGTRGSGSRSGSGGSGGGVEGELKPKEIQDIYSKVREEVVARYKDKEPDRPLEAINAEAADLFASRHAYVMKDDKRGGFVLRAPHPTGVYGDLLHFDTKQKADKAMQQLYRHGVMPTQEEGTSQIRDWRAAGSPSTNLREVEGQMGAREAVRAGRTAEAPPQEGSSGLPPELAHVYGGGYGAVGAESSRSGASAPPMPSAPRWNASASTAAPPQRSWSPPTMRQLPPLLSSDEQAAAYTKRVYDAPMNDPAKVVAAINVVRSKIADAQKGRRPAQYKEWQEELRRLEQRLRELESK